MSAILGGGNEREAALATNIVYFSRALRRAGLRVGPADTIRVVEAVEAAGIGTREEFFWTLHAALVTRHEDHATFRDRKSVV